MVKCSHVTILKQDFFVTIQFGDNAGLGLKIFKSEKIMFGVERYLEEELGSEYAHSPISSMPSLFSAADSATPIIFVLS